MNLSVDLRQRRARQQTSEVVLETSGNRLQQEGRREPGGRVTWPWANADVSPATLWMETATQGLARRGDPPPECGDSACVQVAAAMPALSHAPFEASPGLTTLHGHTLRGRVASTPLQVSQDVNGQDLTSE